MRVLRASVMLFSILLCVACSERESNHVVANISADSTVGKTFTIGDLSDSPAKKIERFLPLADYIAEAFADKGYSSGDVIVTEDPDELADWLNSGKVHMAMDSSNAALTVAGKSGASIELKRWKEGVESYHAVIFALDNTAIKTLDDVKGNILALEDKTSTGGFMQPLGHIYMDGIPLVQVDSPAAAVPSDSIGWFLSGEDENIVKMVLNGEAAIGALGSEDFDEFVEETDAEIRTIATTLDVPRHLVLMSPALEADVKALVTQTLVSMTDSDEGLKVLDHIKETRKFELIRDSDELYQNAKNLYEAARKALGE